MNPAPRSLLVLCAALVNVGAGAESAAADLLTVHVGSCSTSPTLNRYGDVTGMMLRSPNFPEPYDPSGTCEIIVNADAVAQIQEFDTEALYDHLLVGGHAQQISGWLLHGTEMFMEAGTKLTWKSDYATERKGWELAFQPTVHWSDIKIKEGGCKPWDLDDESDCIVSPLYPLPYDESGCKMEAMQDVELWMSTMQVGEKDHLIVGNGATPFQGEGGSADATVHVLKGESIQWVAKDVGGTWGMCWKPAASSEGILAVLSPGGLVAFGSMLCVMLLAWGFDRFWHKKMNRRDEVSQHYQAEDDFRKAVHMHMLPGSSRAGSYSFRGLQEKEEQIALKFDNLGLDLKSGANVLQGVTGEFSAGRMVAIMGPSGAGKTTFMNVLCGKATYGTMRGDVKINGESKSISTLKPIMGFVPQDDIVHEKLTVRENIGFSAYLRNPQPTEKQHNLVVEDVLCVMQIRHIQRSLVGGVEERGISGGQRKRVNIGLEVAADPSLLFLDEPTSGLDATSSLTIIDALRKMTDLGTTIIMVIHQPRYSLFTLFDDVLLLGRGGRTVYLGPSTGALPFFEMKGFRMAERENPADWFMDIISGEIPCTTKNDFKPPDLVNFWLETPASSLQKPVAETTGEDAEAKMERAFLNHLEDEWAKHQSTLVRRRAYGPKHMDDACVSVKQLKALLETCSGGIKPSPDVLQSVLGDYNEDSRCTKDKFLSFFRGTKVEEGDLANAKSKLLEVSMSNPRPAVTRQRPGLLKQLRLIWRRRLIQIYRNNERRMVDVGLIVGCALIAGFLHNNKQRVDLTLLPGNLMIFHLGLGLMIAVSCTKVFGADRPVFWRESASGIKVLAFFLARTLVDLFDLFIQTVVYTVVYYQVAWPTFPHVPFSVYFWPCVLVTLAASGWGYFISTVVPPESTVMGAVIAILIFSGILGNPPQMGDFLSSNFGSLVTFCSLSRWSVQMTFFETMAKARQENMEINEVLTNLEDDYKKGLHGAEISTQVLLGMAIVMRFLAFLGLKYMNRDKQV